MVTQLKRALLRRVDPPHRPEQATADVAVETYLDDRLAALARARRDLLDSDDERALMVLAQRERELRSWLPLE